MSYDILSILQEKDGTFSKGQRRIARYITEAYDKAAFMTANRLGKTVGVSESTVVRFAVDLGFDGYPSMQKAMQEMVLNRLTSVQRIEVANNRLGDQDIVSTVLHSDMEKLRKTDEILNREEFSAAVNAIIKAKRVYILGIRSAEPLANFLGYYLNYMFNNVHILSGFGTVEMFEKIVSVNPEDGSSPSLSPGIPPRPPRVLSIAAVPAPRSSALRTIGCPRWAATATMCSSPKATWFPWWTLW